MAPYMLLAGFIWFSGFFSHNKKFYSLVYFSLLLLVSIFASLRGDFATDYSNYMYMYDRIGPGGVGYDYGVEFGFASLILVADYVFGSFEMFIAIVHFSTVFVFGYSFYRLTRFSWLLLFLFVTIGPYYASFNVTRQIMASSIFFFFCFSAGRGRFGYFIGIAASSLFHKSSLLMVPFYYALRSSFAVSLFFVMFVVVFFAIFGRWVLAVSTMFFEAYTVDREGLVWTNAVLGMLSLFIAVCSYLSGWVKDRFVINGSIFFFAFSIISLEYDLGKRFAYFFSVFFCLLIVRLIERCSRSQERLFLSSLVGILGLLYNYVVFKGSGYDPYYFFFG